MEHNHLSLKLNSDFNLIKSIYQLSSSFIKRKLNQRRVSYQLKSVAHARKLRLPTLAIIGLTYISSAFASPDSTNQYSSLDLLDNRIAKIDHYLTNGSKHGFAGAIVIMQHDKVLLNKGYGSADRATGAANTPDTVFDIGSNTKQFTAAAIMLLEQQGKLKVTDKLSQYFTAIPEDKKVITLHQLLTHTSGLLDSFGNDFEHISDKDFFDYVFNSKLLSKPGSASAYSNIGFSILASVIEKVSGTDYEHFLQSNLFIPANMKATGYLRPKWDRENLANGYARGVMNRGPMVSKYAEDKAISWHLLGNGGINSTQNDMLRWINALKNNHILSDKTFKRYTKSYFGDIEKDHGSAYGWGVIKTDRNTKRLSHHGSNGSFSHSILWSIDEDVVIIYATNASDSKLERVAVEIEKMLFNNQYTSAPIVKNPYFLILDFVAQNPVSTVSSLKAITVKERAEDFAGPEILNRCGYMLLRQDKHLDWAVALFKMNTERFKDSGNLWDSLGDGYKAAGQKTLAIQSYKKAVALGYDESKGKLDDLLSL